MDCAETDMVRSEMPRLVEKALFTCKLGLELRWRKGLSLGLRPRLWVY